jgi:hypothetical protein
MGLLEAALWHDRPQYVVMYKSRVIKIISEQEYRMYPSLWTGVMSARIGMMASLMLTAPTD